MVPDAVTCHRFHGGTQTAKQAWVAMRPEELYHLHKDRVYRWCLRYCGGNTALAEDVTQDVFLKLLEHYTRLADIEAIEPWLYRVTTNACFTRLKRETSVWQRVRQALSMAPQETPLSPETQLQVRQTLQSTLDALQQLPAKERVVFCMHALDEMPQHEIGAILSLSKGYVSKLLQRAHQRLGEMGWEDGND